MSQSTGKFVPVDVLVLWDMSVGAVPPCAARGPPEKALLLVWATIMGKKRQLVTLWIEL